MGGDAPFRCEPHRRVVIHAAAEPPVIRQPGMIAAAWFCDGCGSWYFTAKRAAACCGPIEPAYGYRCPVCGTVHQEQGQAIECCHWDQEPEGRRALHQAAEYAGQLSLQL